LFFHAVTFAGSNSTFTHPGCRTALLRDYRLEINFVTRTVVLECVATQ
jgi:hypothetical protein